MYLSRVCVWLCIFEKIVNKVILVQSIFRHGARESLSPEFRLAKDMEGSPGELTSVGLRQHYNLGQLMRQKYILQEKVLSETYDNEQVYVRSTDTNRTIMSVLAQLQGLFPQGTGPQLNISISSALLVPPNKDAINLIQQNQQTALPNQMQLVPVHIQQLEYDYLLKSYTIQTCQINKKYVLEQENSEINRQAIRNMTDIFQWAQQHFDIKITNQNRNLYTIGDIFDNYYVNKYKNLAWYLDERDYLFKKFKYAYYWGFLYLEYCSPEQIKLYNSEFFKQIYQNMVSRIENRTQTKLYLYSGHDTNLLSVMVGLNLTNQKCVYNQFYDIPNSDYCLDFPTFASNMQFELHQQNKLHFVKIIYNSQPIKLQQCGYHDQCTLEEFRQIQQSFYIENFESVCKDRQDYGQMLSSQQTVLVVVLGSLAAFLILFVVYLSIRLKRVLNKRSKNYKDMSEYI